MKLIIHIIFFLLALICSSNSLAANDSIKPDQTLEDNGQTLVSTDQTFELGFFSPANSKNRFVGIWYKNIPDFTVVWIANRDNPLSNSSSGVLTITQTGSILILSNQTVVPIWSSNSSVENPTSQLLDTGNLVLNTGNSQSYAWQRLTIHVTRKQPVRMIRLCIGVGRDGVRLGSYPRLQNNSVVKPLFVFNETHLYNFFENADESTISRFLVSPMGSPQHLVWSHGRCKWLTMYTLQKDEWNDFAHCRSNGICNLNQDPICHCPSGFAPKSPRDWARYNRTRGCVLRTRLECGVGEGFKGFPSYEAAYGSKFVVNRTVVRKEECEAMGRETVRVRTSGCALWFQDLLDMKVFSVGGQDLYVRVTTSELGMQASTH